MKREDITRILEGIALTDEQAKALLDLNSADITRALGKQKADLDAANDALKEAKATISGLESAKGDAEKLQQELDAYKTAEAERVQKETQAAERAELLERMDAAMGDRKFIHDRMRELVAEDFRAALSDRANRGKSDREIFDAVTRDQGYFANANRVQVDMPHMETIEPTRVVDRDGFFKLSFAQQTAFKRDYPTEFNQLFHAPNPTQTE